MRVTLILMILILFSTPCFAEDRVYSYTDETGQKIYTNEKRPPTPITKQPSNNISRDSFPNSYQSPTVVVPEPPSTKNTQGWYERRDPVNTTNQAPPPVIKQNAVAPRINYKHANDPITELVSFLSKMIALVIMVFILWFVALIDILRHEFTGSNKMIWFLAVTFLPLLGPVLYYFIGSSQKVFDPGRIERPTDY